MQIKISFTFLLISMLFLTACGSKDNTEPPAPLPKFQSSVTIQKLWTAHTGGKSKYFKLEPAFDNEKIFVASSEGDVRALHVENGKIAWKKNLKITISGGVSAGADLVLLGSSKGKVVALSQEDGRELWRAQVSSEILTSPQINQNTVVVRTGDGNLFGLDSQTGRQLWLYEREAPLFTLRGTSKPIVLSDIIIAGFDNGKMAILDLNTGVLLGEFLITEPKGRFDVERIVDIDSNPLFSNGIIYISSVQDLTAAVDIFGEDKKILWNEKIASYTGFAVNRRNLFTTDTQSHIWALDRYSGAAYWKQDKLQFRGVTAPALIDNYVIIGDKEGYLHCLDEDSGQFAAYYKIGSSVLVPPLVIDNKMIAVNSDGKVLALQLKK